MRISSITILFQILPIRNTIQDIAVLQLDGKFGESKWNRFWLIVLMSSSGSNHVLNEDEGFDFPSRNSGTCIFVVSSISNFCHIVVSVMEPPTMLLVPICRDMQLWWDKPPIPSPRNRMPGDTCFDDVGRNCACVTWTQMYVTLQTKNVFHSKAVIILFFNPPLC